MSTLDTRLGTVRDWITQLRLGNPTTPAPAVLPGSRQTLDMGPGEILEIVHASDPDYQRLISLAEQVFEPGASLIPAMTGESSPLCSVSSSSSYSQADGPWRAADGTPTTHWSVGSSLTHGWWRCVFPASKTAVGYAITARNPYGDSGPKDWTLRGSNDGVNWTVLDAQSGVIWSNSQRREFSLAQPASFTWWEINITASARPDYAAPLALAEVQFYAPATQRILVPASTDYQIEYLADRTRIKRLAAERRLLTATVRL
ncbi:MAG: discoidin domain-containing protein [Pseudomonadota bacterium]|nr:discoidin domain-containing protein [Pseudomonadota bacterium]